MASSPQRKKMADALDKEQKRRKIPFNMRIYICPLCSNRLVQRTNIGNIAYYYCKNPNCDHSQKVNTVTDSIEYLIQENKALKEENRDLKQRLNGSPSP